MLSAQANNSINPWVTGRRLLKCQRPRTGWTWRPPMYVLYNYASHVESIGEFTAAINWWEDWSCIMKGKDKYVHTIWQCFPTYVCNVYTQDVIPMVGGVHGKIRYVRNLETVSQFYQDGGYHTSIVWIHCYMGRWVWLLVEGVTTMSQSRLLMK